MFSITHTVLDPSLRVTSSPSLQCVRLSEQHEPTHFAMTLFAFVLMCSVPGVQLYDFVFK